MHYVFALATAFLASTVAANVQERGYAYEYHTVTVTERRPQHVETAYGEPRTVYRNRGHRGHRGWRKHRKNKPTPKPVYEEPEEEQDEEDDEEDDEVPVEEEPVETPTYGDIEVPEKKPEKQKSKKPSKGPSDPLAAECLKAHNDKRALHGAEPLEWDEEMKNHAQRVCNKCVFEHSGSKFGENLAAGYESAAAAIQAWYDENSMYDYGSGDFSSGTGHFTQMVWKGAKKVGCAVTECNGDNGTPGKFLTCNYDTGNVIGQFQENVSAN